VWIYTSTPPYAFMTSCLISKAQGTTLPFTFTNFLGSGCSGLISGTDCPERGVDHLVLCRAKNVPTPLSALVVSWLSTAVILHLTFMFNILDFSF
jgi:hypothetical protein